MNDPGYVASLEELRKEQEAKGRRAPSGELISEATPEVRELRSLASKITRLTNVVLGFAGSKPIQDEVRKYMMANPGGSDVDKRLAKHRAIVARVLPSKAPAAESPTAKGSAEAQ